MSDSNTYASSPSSFFDSLKLSVPYQGIHKCRIGPFALFDTVLTILVCLLIWYYTAPRCWGTGRFVIFLCLVFLLSVPIHMYFGVETEGVKRVRAWWNGNDSEQDNPSTKDTTTSSSLSTTLSNHLNTVKSLFTGSSSSSSSNSPSPSEPEAQISGAGQDTDYYPLDREDWRASPFTTQYQDFSQI